MISKLLTIVIPTRNRPDFLESCLQSVFERQTTIPKVIVSDNSTAQLPGIDILRRKYEFTYIRQSGTLSMTDHHNACLGLPSTPWAFLLHDDDELFPNILEKLDSVLSDTADVGIVIGGIEFIDEKGSTRGAWIPETTERIRGEEGVLRLGLDFRASPPGCIWNVPAFQQVGGFPDANGTSADQTLVLRLTFSHGAKLLPQIVGRYRIGAQQITDYSTPERAEYILDCTIQMARLTRTIGVSQKVADQLVDYMIWWIFRIAAGNLFLDHPFFVSRLFYKCLLETPPTGYWKSRVKLEYPLLFVRPQWFSLFLYKTAKKFLPVFIRRALLSYARVRIDRKQRAPDFYM